MAEWWQLVDGREKLHPLALVGAQVQVAREATEWLSGRLTTLWRPARQLVIHPVVLTERPTVQLAQVRPDEQTNEQKKAAPDAHRMVQIHSTTTQVRMRTGARKWRTSIVNGAYAGVHVHGTGWKAIIRYHCWVAQCCVEWVGAPL